MIPTSFMIANHSEMKKMSKSACQQQKTKAICTTATTKIESNMQNCVNKYILFYIFSSAPQNSKNERFQLNGITILFEARKERLYFITPDTGVDDIIYKSSHTAGSVVTTILIYCSVYCLTVS